MHIAAYWSKLANNQVQCHLCPHLCKVSNRNSGICGVRYNDEGTLYSRVYGVLSSITSDPVEKKPLYHYFPGSQMVSIGSFGCTMKCDFCQNCEISQGGDWDLEQMDVYEPDEIISRAIAGPNVSGIAFTYNEPVVFTEYVLDTARRAHEAGLVNAMITNGYITIPPLEELLTSIDAFNIDLKAFTENFYKKVTRSQLAPVLKTIKKVSEAGKHLEITHLVIPGRNDNIDEFENLVRWIRDTCGKQTVLHLSRYFPRYKSDSPPTPSETLLSFMEIARKELHFVYAGNIAVDSGSDTFCPGCGNKLVERHLYHTRNSGITGDGFCKTCGYKIYGTFHKHRD